MLTIELTFPGGRYHATPWDQHVNEGGVEWPPCPWRILRALVATWHTKRSQQVSESGLESILNVLAQDAPHFTVPPAVAAHTRHYMPIGQLKDGVERTAKVFDTFVHVGRTEKLFITWPSTTLTDPQRADLESLLSAMGYLGRAESWIQARLSVNDADADTVRAPVPANVVPLPPNQDVSAGTELVRLLAPMTVAAITEWRGRAFEEELGRLLEKKRSAAKQKGKDPSKLKLSKTDKDNTDASLPRTLLEALRADTGGLHKQGWSAAPGTQWLDYVRPPALLTTTAARRSPPQTEQHPTAARFALASQVPPRLTSALSVAERVRTSLMSRSGGSTVFSGRDENDDLLRGHQHAFILPEANGANGHITHVTLFAPMGFDQTAREAMANLRKVWGHDDHDLQLILLGTGHPKDFGGLNTQAGQCPLLAASTTWISRTPFVPTRHPKTTQSGAPKLDENDLQIGSPEHDLRRLLREAGYPNPVSVEPVDATDLSGNRTPWLDFKTIRKRGGGARSSNKGYGFRLRFESDVQGPIALGFGAHFGLGGFVAE